MRNHNFRIHDRSEQGFTIVELMVATLVFSLVLLTLTFGVIDLSKAYYRGVNSSTTQNTAQSIMDSITQTVQFSGSAISTRAVYRQPGASNGVTYLCAGGKVYTYRPGVQYLGAAASSSNPGLYQSDETDGCQPPAVGAGNVYIGTNGRQLLAKHMRLAVLDLSSGDAAVADAIGQSYTATIRLAYSSGGDAATDGDDLLCKPSGTAHKTACDTAYGPGTTADDFSGNDIRCRVQEGSQFCAVYGLTSSVLQRIDTD